MSRRLVLAAPAIPVLLYLPFLAHGQLGFDEIATYDATTRTPAALWGMLLHRTDGTLGAWYWLERPVVALAGHGPGALRLPSLLAAAGTAVVVAAIGNELGGRRTGLLASLALLCNPAFWEFANLARPYTTALLTASGCLLVLVRARGRQLSARAAAVFGLCAAATVYLQAMFLFFLLAQGAALLLLPDLRLSRRRLLVALGAAALATLPLALVASHQTGQTSWIPHTSPRSLFTETAVLFGGDGGLSVAALALWGALVVVALASRAAWSRELTALGVLPPLVVAALGLVLHVFNAAYMLYALVPLSVVAGAGAAVAVDRRPKAAVAGLAALVAVGVAGFSIQSDRDYLHENLQGAATYVAAHAAPGEGVLFAPDWTRVPLSYWLDKSHARLVDLAEQPVADVRAVPDLYLPEHPRPQVEQAALSTNRVWVLGYPGDPWRPTPNTGGDVAASLPSQGFRVVERHMFGIVGVELLERAR